MTDIKVFRRQYGITQEELGLYLGLSESMIKMAEAGARTLSAAALIKLNALMQTVETNVAANSKRPVHNALHPDDKAIALIQKRLQEINLQLHKLRQKQERQAGIQQVGLQKKDLVHLLQPAVEGKAQESTWLRLMELNATAKHNSYLQVKQQLRQARLSSLLYEKEQLEALLSAQQPVQLK